MSVCEVTSQYATIRNAGSVFTRVFEVAATSFVDAKQQLDSEMDVREGMIYEDHQGNRPDATLYCQPLEMEQYSPAPAGGGIGVFRIIARYSRIVMSGRQLAFTALNVSQRTYEYTETSEPYDVDQAGRRLRNSAMEAFDPPCTMERTHSTLVCTWLTQSLSIGSIQEAFKPFIDKVNAAPFEGWARGELKMYAPQVQPVSLEGTFLDSRTLYLVTARLGCRQNYTRNGTAIEGWQIARLNYGKRTRSIAGGTQTEPIFHGDFPVSEPVPLSADGTAVLSTDANPIILVFDAHMGYANFAGIIPPSMEP